LNTAWLPELFVFLCCASALYTEGFSHFVSSMTAPISSGWSNIAGWDLHPLKNAAFARRTPNHTNLVDLTWRLPIQTLVPVFAIVELEWFSIPNWQSATVSYALRYTSLYFRLQLRCLTSALLSICIPGSGWVCRVGHSLIA